jgi:ferredoxin
VAAIDVADRVARAGRDEEAVRRRAETVIVAANCTRSGPTCFCTSMGTGPAASVGYDLALTELTDEDHHRLVVEAATERGAELLARVDSRAATEAEVTAAARAVDGARDQERSVDLHGLYDALLGSLEHDRWDDVADRCLSCGNCTLVCPTCFCTTIEDRTHLDDEWTDRNRRWESCFSLDHSHLGRGSVRDTVRDRYRQWLTHKLATWVDQFDEVGCVGCGRCLTWCPVGIDLTEEVAALREPLPGSESTR